MALRGRMTISAGAPDGSSSWQDEGADFTLATATAITGGSALLIPVQTVTRPNTMLPGGQTQVDTLPAGSVIQSLFGAQIGPVSALAATTSLTLALTVYRNVGLGVALASGVAITSLTLAAPLVSPMPSGQTIAIANVSGNTTTATLSAAAAVGATTVSINSLTPANLYPITSYAVAQVGNMPCFGWLYNPGGGFTGASGQNGTPQLAAHGVIQMPTITSNTALVTPANGSGSYLPLAIGDLIEFLVQTSTGTPTIPVSNVQLLLV